jgi:tetratricopeptide (TPR) repeat protein
MYRNQPVGYIYGIPQLDSLRLGFNYSTLTLLFLAAGIFSLVLGLIFGMRATRAILGDEDESQSASLITHIVTASILTVAYWLVCALPLAGLWVAFLAPIDHFGTAPGAISSPELTDTLSSVFAVAVWAVIASLSAIGLTVVWSLGLSRFSSSEYQASNIVVAILLAGGLLAFGWESGGWPTWSVILLELGLISIVVNTCEIVLARVWRKSSRVGIVRIRAGRLGSAVSAILITCLMALTVFIHDGAPIWANLLGVFAVLASLDHVVAAIVAITSSRLSTALTLSPQRWRFTTPVVLAICLLGGAGLFASMTSNHGIGYPIWMEAGAAAIAYTIFNPLVGSARRIAERRAAHPIIEDTVRAFLARISADIFNPTSASSIETSSASPIADLRVGGAVDGLQHRYSSQVSEWLRFPTWGLFLTSALMYNFLLTHFQFGSLLELEFAPVIIGGAGAAAGLLQLVDNPIFESPRYASNILLLVLVMLTAVAELCAIANVSQLSQSDFAFGPEHVLSLETYYSATIANLDRALLWLFVVGELVYLYVIAKASLGDSQFRASDQNAHYWYDTGNSMSENGRLEKARFAYRQALKHDEYYVEAHLRLATVIEQLSGSEAALDAYLAALSAIDHVLRHEGNTVEMLEFKGTALIGLKRYDKALEVFEKALHMAPNDVELLIRTAELLYRYMIRYDDAIKLCERALALSPSAAKAAELRAAALTAVAEIAAAESAI